ncbi:MAG: efflux transporter outer membrane subunit [Tepidisphaeraceae bacterium]
MTRPLLKRPLLALSLGIAFAAQGCLVGPDYHPAPTPTPSTWADPGAQSYPTSQPARPSTQPASLADWWRGFNDPELTSLIERAIAENLDIRQATSRIRQSRASLGIVRASLFPQVDTNASYDRSAAGNGDHASGLYHAGLDASWEIDIFGGLRRSVEVAGAQIDAAVEDRRDILVSVVAEVALDYADLRGFQRQIDIARGNVKSQQASADLTRKLFNNGNGFNSRLDVVNSDALVAGTAGQIPLLETSERQTIYALSVLLNQDPARLMAELSQRRPIPVAPLDVPMGLPSDLIRRRPDIRRAEAQVHAATAEIGVATADLFPKFSLTGNFGFTNGKPASLFDYASHSWSFGPSVSWPLFDAGRITSNIHVQDELQLQALLFYRSTVLNALRDVDSALVAYVKEYEHRQAVVAQVDANRQAVQLATQLYQNGNTDFLNVLSAQRSLYSSEDQLVQSDRNTVTNLIALYKALGGGWETK